MKRWVDYIWVGCGYLIVNDNHQVLLIKRTDKSQWGGWGFRAQPGGTIEFGDTLENTVKREIKEELNVDIELIWPQIFAEDIREENGIKKHRFTGGCFAKIIWGDVKIMEPEKCSEVKWFDLDNLPEPIIWYTRPFIEKYRERIKWN